MKAEERLKIVNEGELHFLELIKGTLADSGDYTCTASNTAGASYCTVNVTVSGRNCLESHTVYSVVQLSLLVDLKLGLIKFCFRDQSP